MTPDQLSLYSNTPVTESGFLDILRPVKVPASPDDVLYSITTSYTFRPDLLAYDLYGEIKLWWVFAQRNPDILKDPVFDFRPGTEIFLPQGKHLREKLGF